LFKQRTSPSPKSDWIFHRDVRCLFEVGISMVMYAQVGLLVHALSILNFDGLYHYPCNRSLHNLLCFHTFKIFSSKYGRDCNVCFYFNHWFCKEDLTFARHVNVQNKQFPSYIMARSSYIRWDEGCVQFVVDHYA
jgi:hypothetical protein